MELSSESSKIDINTFFGKCRCCLEYGYMKSMWSEYERDGIREIYGEMMMETFSVTWESLDDSQDYICEPCVLRLRDAYDFKKEVLASEQLMFEDFEDLDENSIKVEVLEDFNDFEQENVPEDDSEDKPSVSETEYYEVEYLEDEIEFNEETGLATTKAEQEQPKKELKWPQKKRREDVKRPYKNYSAEELQHCLEAVRDKSMSITEASELFRIPRKTICAKLNEQSKKKPDTPWVCSRRLRHPIPEVKRHRENLRAVLEYSNATPFKSQTGMFFTCNFCQKPYTQPKALKEHTLELHEDDSIASKIKVSFGFSIKLDITGLECKLCGEDFELLEDLMAHLAIYHGIIIHTDVPNQMVPYKFDSKVMKCAVCCHSFNFFKLLAEHMSEHYRNFECELCGTPFINKQRYKMHKERHKSGVYFCSFCPKAFDNKMRRRDHERVVHVHNKKTHKCNYCAEKFANPVKKSEHERSFHGGTCRIFKCNDCGIEFDNNTALSIHTKKMHPVSKPYQCSECDTSFYKKSSLSKHVEMHKAEEISNHNDMKEPETRREEHGEKILVYVT